MNVIELSVVLMRDGEPVRLGPKFIDTLIVLVENAGHIVDKDELIDRVWPDSFVEDGSLTRNISVLRKCSATGQATSSSKMFQGAATALLH